MSDELQNAKVLCGKCRSSVQGPTAPEAGDIITCSNADCGNSDTYENVHAECQAYYQDQASRALQNQMKGMAKKGKFITMTYSGTEIPHRDYKFVLDII